VAKWFSGRSETAQGVGTSFQLELIKLGHWSILPVGASKSWHWSILLVGVGKPGHWSVFPVEADKLGGWSLLLVVAGEFWKL